MNITQMKEGERGIVIEIKGEVKKLDSLGIRAGVEITKISAQLLRGPIIVQVGNNQVAIGYSMARRIIVETKS